MDIIEIDHDHWKRFMWTSRCLLKIGAVLIKTEENLTNEENKAGVLPHSFRLTILGGNKNDVAQCIFDNRCIGVISIGNTSGVAKDYMSTESIEHFNYYKNYPEYKIN